MRALPSVLHKGQRGQTAACRGICSRAPGNVPCRGAAECVGQYNPATQPSRGQGLARRWAGTPGPRGCRAYLVPNAPIHLEPLPETDAQTPRGRALREPAQRARKQLRQQQIGRPRPFMQIASRPVAAEPIGGGGAERGGRTCPGMWEPLQQLLPGKPRVGSRLAG